MILITWSNLKIFKSSRSEICIYFGMEGVVIKYIFDIISYCISCLVPHHQINGSIAKP